MLIYQHEFNGSHLPLVQQFNCGSEIWSEDANRWIKGFGPEDCAKLSIARSDRLCRVWLYSDTPSLTPESLVGYGSIGTGKWPLEGEKLPVGVIPFFAVDTRYQGVACEGGESFATAIYRDVLAQANMLLPASTTFLGLYVHPQNIRGIRFWSRCGYVDLPGRAFFDKETNVTYQGMVVQFR